MINDNSTSSYEKLNIYVIIEEKLYSSGNYSEYVPVSSPYSMSSYNADNQINHLDWEKEYQKFPFVGPIHDNSYLMTNCPQVVYDQEGIPGIVNYIVSKYPGCLKISENEISVTVFLRTIR